LNLTGSKHLERTQLVLIRALHQKTRPRLSHSTGGMLSKSRQ